MEAQSRRRDCRPGSKTRSLRSGGVAGTARAAAAGKRDHSPESFSAAEEVLLDRGAARVLGDALV